MRALLAAALLAPLLAPTAAARGVGPAAPVHCPQELVHYYVDSGCSDCSPDDDLETGDYWLITSTIHAGQRQDLERAADRFRAALRRRFDRPESITTNVVVRFRDTAAQARRGREGKIDKMRQLGYRIIEIEIEAAGDRVGGDPGTVHGPDGGARPATAGSV